MDATRRPAIRHADSRENNSNFKERKIPTSPKHGKRTEGLIQEYSEGNYDEDEVLGYDEVDRCWANSSSNEYALRSASTPGKRGAIDPPAAGTTLKRKGAVEENFHNKAKNECPDDSSLLREEEQCAQKKKSKFGPSPMIKIAAVTLAISAIAIISIYFRPNIVMRETEIVTILPLETKYKEVEQNLQILIRHSEQPRKFWVQVMNQVKNLFIPDPQQPSILLVLIPSNSKKTAVCLVHKLQEIVTSAFKDQKYVLLDGHSSSLLAADTARHQFDERLSELSSHHVAIIHNIEKIPTEAVTILHAYCDNENAPHKRALIILTIGSNLPYDSLSIENAATNIDEILEALWRDKIRDDDIPPIISRIANAPVLVKPESKYVIEDLCPS